MTDVSQFIASACPDHTVRGRPAHDIALFKATRMLEKDPSLADASFECAIVCGKVDRVRRELDARPALATSKGGPKDWEPLLYLAFTRLLSAAARENSIAIASLLLDRGANPNAFFKAGDSDYTPLVGAIGEGEEDRPAHARRDDLVNLLLDRGAEPYDMQVVYNVHFHATSVLWWLRLMHAHSLRRGRDADWRDADWPMLAMGGYGSGARWHYWIAIEHGDLALATWCAEHGANVNAAPARDHRFSKRSLYEDALLFGRDDIADVLARHGAARVELRGEDAFVAACRRGDRGAAERLAREHPEYVLSHKTLSAAARRDDAGMLAMLYALGASLGASGDGGETALHTAAYAGAADATQFLLEHGAAIDVVERNYDSTPLGWAVHGGRQNTIDILAAHSRDLMNLVYLGRVDRVRELLRQSPQLANQRHWREQATPLMWLPNDDALAVEMARLLMDAGADPSATNASGTDAATIAERRQLDQAARVIRDAQRTE